MNDIQTTLSKALSLMDTLLDEIAQLPLKERTKPTNIQAVSSCIRALLHAQKADEETDDISPEEIDNELAKHGIILSKQSKLIKAGQLKTKEIALEHIENHINAKSNQ